VALSGAEHIGFGRATSSLLPVLGVKPAYGRWFTREDEDQGQRVAVLGRALWQRRFGSDPGIVGRSVQISGLPFEIIGVLAGDLELPEHFDAWRPLAFTPAQLTPQARAARGLRVIGRLARGVTLPGLRSELSVVSARLRASYPDIYPADFGFEMAAVPLLDQMVGQVKLTLWMLFGAVVLVLLMACANVGNLLLARATARQRELAVRAALGAGRSRLVQQMLVESVVLALLGGALGFLIAVWGVDLLLAAGPRDLPRSSHIRVDFTVLSFALAASLVSGILFGLVPAVACTDASLGGALRGGGASSAPRPRRLRRALVVADVALALVLLSGTALLLRSFRNVVHVDPGFDPKGVVALTLGIAGADQKHRTVVNSTLERLRDLPGSEAAGVSTTRRSAASPTTRASKSKVARFRRARSRPTRRSASSPRLVRKCDSPRSRPRLRRDRRTRALPVVTVNEALARKYWPSADPLGQRCGSSAIRAGGRSPAWSGTSASSASTRTCRRPSTSRSINFPPAR
jgi:predicted permease